MTDTGPTREAPITVERDGYTFTIWREGTAQHGTVSDGQEIVARLWRTNDDDGRWTSTGSVGEPDTMADAASWRDTFDRIVDEHL